MGKAAAVEIDRPTDEQRRRVLYVLGPVHTERGQVVGRAYARIPLYERLASQACGIGDRELSVLRHYRGAFDRYERSPMKSCLNFFPDIEGRSDAERAARQRAREVMLECEAPLGMLVHTMRAVALKDMTFAQIALDRYGTRRRPWVFVDKDERKEGKHLELLEPRSGSVAEVEREFFAGLKLLTGHREHRW